MLKFLHSFHGVMDVGCQVTVEEADRVTIKGETDAHPSFITLSRKDRVTVKLKIGASLHYAIFEHSLILDLGVAAGFSL